MTINFGIATRILVGIVLVAYGSFEWSARLSYKPDTERLRQSGLELTDFASPDQERLSDACRNLEKGSGWLLLVIRTKLNADQVFRGYFESAPDELGVYAEYDPFDAPNGPSFRLGIASQPQNVLVNLRTVRRDEDAFVALGIQPDQIRVVTNGVDRVEPLGTSFQPAVNCESPTVGLADDVGCGGCGISVKYAAGSDIVQLNEALSVLSNARSYEIRRAVGTACTFVGFVLVLFPVPKLRVRRKRVP